MFTFQARYRRHSRQPCGTEPFVTIPNYRAAEKDLFYCATIGYGYCIIFKTLYHRYNFNDRRRAGPSRASRMYGVPILF
jgi:hypothetical protein